MARKKGRGIGDVNRYTSGAARPPSFGQEDLDDAITSGTSFFLISLAVFIAITVAAVHFGTRNIENDLEVRSEQALLTAGFPDVEVDAIGATVHLSGSMSTEQSEADAFAAIANLGGVNSVDGKLWPVFDGELEEIELTDDAINISWDGDDIVIVGNIASEDRRTFIADTLTGTFGNIDISGLVVLEGLQEDEGWLGDTLGLLIRVQPSLVSGKMIVDPNGKLLVVGGEVEDKDLRNELNEEVTQVADGLGFDANPAIRIPPEPRVGPTVEEVQEFQVDLNELIGDKVVEFEIKSFDLTDTGVQLLDEILEALQQAPDIRVRIEGHTDSQGSTEANQKLSEDRANAVLAYLVEHGESADRFDIIGYGETDPAVSNDTAEGRAHNRRIEFIALESAL